MAKYRVETDAGVYEVETDEPTSGGPSTLQKAGEVLSTPFRGTRALGVGAQHLVQKAIPGGENMPLEDILMRSAEATKPGFEAKPGERIGAALGVSGPALPLAASSAPVLGPAAVAAFGKGSESLAEGKGPLEAGKEAAIEGGTSAVVGGLIQGASSLGNAALRNALARGKGLTREVVDAVLDSPMLQASPGAKKAVSELRTAMIDAKNAAGKHIGDIRKGLGLPDNVAETETRILAGEAGTPTPQEALTKAKEAIALTKATKNPGSSRLNDLLEAKARLRDVQEFSKGAQDPAFKLKSTESVVFQRQIEALDRMIDEIPGGSALRNAQETYGEVLRDFSEFSNKLQTEGASEQFISSVVKQGENLTGRLKDAADAIRRIEQRTMGNKLAKAMQETAKEQFSGAAGSGVAGTVTEAIEKTIGSNTVKGIARLGVRGLKALDKAKSASSPLVRALRGEVSRQEK